MPNYQCSQNNYKQISIVNALPKLVFLDYRQESEMFILTARKIRAKSQNLNSAQNLNSILTARKILVHKQEWTYQLNLDSFSCCVELTSFSSFPSLQFYLLSFSRCFAAVLFYWFDRPSCKQIRSVQ